MKKQTIRTDDAPPGNGKPSARFRFRITVGDVVAVGPGKVSLLEAIGATGSIQAAAQSLDMSYRRAWLLLNEMNTSFHQPVVASARGGSIRGGSELTPVGLQLVETYRAIEEKAARACADEIAELVKLVAA